LLSGLGPNGGKTSDFASPDKATQALYKLDPAQITADLNAVADYALKLPAGNGKITVAGFCWGGGQCFRFATQRQDLKAAFVFYGSFAETREALAKIACPVYGFYGENDARINATVPKSAATMKELGKVYEPVTYYPARGMGTCGWAKTPRAVQPTARRGPIAGSGCGPSSRASERGRGRRLAGRGPRRKRGRGRGRGGWRVSGPLRLARREQQG
jgi:dienelactone hydrolase